MVYSGISEKLLFSSFFQSEEPVMKAGCSHDHGIHKNFSSFRRQKFNLTKTSTHIKSVLSVEFKQN